MANKQEIGEKHPLLPVKKDGDVVSESVLFDPVDPFDEEEYLTSEEFLNDMDEIKERNNQAINIDTTKATDRAARELRVEALKTKYTFTSSKLLMHMITVVHTNYENRMKIEDNCSYEAFVYELSEFVLVLLEDIKREEDNDPPKMSAELTETFGISINKKSILHHAAEKNLARVTESIYGKFPSLLTNRYYEGNVYYLPLDFALKPKDGVIGSDDTASFLIKKTDREMFLERLIVKADEADDEDDEDEKGHDVETPNDAESQPDPEPYKIKFSDLVKREDMKKTVMSILDHLMDLRWPFNYVTGSNLTDIPNMPIRYHFNFNLLECDDEGRMIGHRDYKGKSCLQTLIEGPHKECAMKHPVVRKLAIEKWKKPYDICCGAQVKHEYILKFFLAMYALYLVLMSFSFFLQPLNRSPNTYENSEDYFRLFCEVGTLILTFIYFFAELVQMRVEGCKVYIGCGGTGWKPKDLDAFLEGFFNVCDVVGSLLIIVIIPLHILGNHHLSARCIISGFAYFINFLRIFKFFPAVSDLGVYSRTFAVIIFRDLPKFVVLLFVFMMSYTGAVYLFLRSNGKLKGLDDNGKPKEWDFWDILLKEFMIVTQAAGFEDEYKSDKYSVYLIIFLMINMFCIMVILLNFLIGQISYRYAKALETAKINNDIDRTKLIVTAESLIAFLCKGKRVPMKSIYVKNDADLQNIIQHWIEMRKEEKKGEEISREFVALSGGIY